MAANEASAVGSLRTINTAEVTYSSTYPDCGFTDLVSLGGAGGTSTGAGLIDEVLAGGTKSGYSFAVSPTGGSGCTTPNSSYSATGDPSNAQTGQRHFFTDQSGVIRADPSAAATATSKPI